MIKLFSASKPDCLFTLELTWKPGFMWKLWGLVSFPFEVLIGLFTGEIKVGRRFWK